MYEAKPLNNSFADPGPLRFDYPHPTRQSPRASPTPARLYVPLLSSTESHLFLTTLPPRAAIGPPLQDGKKGLGATSVLTPPISSSPHPSLHQFTSKELARRSCFAASLSFFHCPPHPYHFLTRLTTPPED
eukprot:766205-Hanusia_phi.AAC.3